MGGLSRKALQIEQLSKENDLPILVIDAGGTLFKGLSGGTSPALQATAEGIVDAYEAMGTTAMGLAPQDFGGGTAFLRSLAEKAGFPLLAANVVDASSKRPLFGESLVVEVGATRVGIIGLSGGAPVPVEDNVRFLPWKEVLPGLLADLKGRVDLLVLLSSLGSSTNEAIAREHENLHLIFQSGSNGQNTPPQLVNNTLLCRTSTEGKYLGRLKVDWRESGRWDEDNQGRLTALQSELDRLLVRIDRMEKRLGAEQLGADRSYQALLTEKNRIERDMEALGRAEGQGKALQPATFENLFIGLTTALPEDPKVAEILGNTRARVNELNRQRQVDRPGRAGALVPNPGAKPGSTRFGLAGYQACEACHALQVDAWKQTRHARAFETLAAKRQQYNPACLPCHVTLPAYDAVTMTEERYFTNLPPGLRTIGCEACHGPAAAHAAAPDQAAPRMPREADCRACHSAERDDDFVLARDTALLHCGETP